MNNITKLKCWDTLQNLGFEPINYFAHGKKVAIGASLRKELISISGEKFKTDIITIEPHQFSDKKNYHISGKINTPYCDTFYRYEYGRKVELYEMRDTINSFFHANNILPTIQKMLA